MEIQNGSTNFINAKQVRQELIKVHIDKHLIFLDWCDKIIDFWTDTSVVFYFVVERYQQIYQQLYLILSELGKN